MKTKAYLAQTQSSKIDMSLDDIIKMNKGAYRRPRRKIGGMMRFKAKQQTPRRNAKAFRRPKNRMYSNYSYESQMFVYQNQSRYEHNINNILQTRQTGPPWRVDMVENGLPEEEIEFGLETPADEPGSFFMPCHPQQTSLQFLLSRQKRAALYLQQLQSQIGRLQYTAKSRLAAFTNNTLYSDVLGSNHPPIVIADVGDETSGPINDTDTFQQPIDILNTESFVDSTNNHALLPSVRVKPKDKKSSILRISIMNHAASLSTLPKKRQRRKSINFSVLNLDDVNVKQATTNVTLHQRFTAI